MSQNPSAEEATTGPNSLATTRVKARMPATDAHGRSPRAATQPAVSQIEAVCCAWRIEDTIMAPMTTMEKTIT